MTEMRRPLWLGLGAPAALSVALAMNAAAQTTPGDFSPERLIPEDAQAVQTDGAATAKGSDEEIIGNFRLRTPLLQTENGYLLLQGDGYLAQDFENDQGFWGGDVGLILRRSLSPQDAWGINAFIDLGDYTGFAGQGSVGLEYEHLGSRGTSYRLGANAYIPFSDYSQDRDQKRAPRLGADAYIGIGQDHGWHRFEGFLTGFYYDSTAEAKSLYGVVGELEYRYSGFDALPEGSHFYASAGARYDSAESALSPLFGIGFTITLQDDKAHERVAEVRRNIGFSSPFVPFEYRASKAASLDCGPGEPPADQQFVANLELTDHDGDPGELFAPANFPTLADITGLPAIEAICGGFAQCVTLLSNESSVNVRAGDLIIEGDRALLTKAAGQCDWVLTYTIIAG